MWRDDDGPRRRIVVDVGLGRAVAYVITDINHKGVCPLSQRYSPYLLRGLAAARRHTAKSGIRHRIRVLRHEGHRAPIRRVDDDPVHGDAVRRHIDVVVRATVLDHEFRRSLVGRAAHRCDHDRRRRVAWERIGLHRAERYSRARGSAASACTRAPDDAPRTRPARRPVHNDLRAALRLRGVRADGQEHGGENRERNRGEDTPCDAMRVGIRHGRSEEVVASICRAARVPLPKTLLTHASTGLREFTSGDIRTIRVRISANSREFARIQAASAPTYIALGRPSRGSVSAPAFRVPRTPAASSLRSARISIPSRRTRR